MNKVIRIISAVMVGILCFACFAACSTSVQPWTDKNVVFTYDNNGNVTITFPDNYQYAKAKFSLNKSNNSLMRYSPNENSFNEEMELRKYWNDIDSLYLVKILQRYTNEEAEKFEWYEDEPPMNYSTYFKAVVIYDFLNEKEVNKEFIYRFPMREGTMPNSFPLYSAGDTFVACLATPDEYGVTNTVLVANMFVNSSNITMDSFVMSDGYKMSTRDDDGNLLAEIKDYVTEVEESEKYLETDFEGKNRVFVEKIKLGDYVNFIKNALEKVGYEIK